MTGSCSSHSLHTYGFKSKKYMAWKGEDYEWINKISLELENLSARYCLKVLALGYADLSNKTQALEYCKIVYNLAEKYNFTPYVSNVYLNKVNTICPLPSLKSYTVQVSTSKHITSSLQSRVNNSLRVLILALLLAVVVLALAVAFKPKPLS